MSYLLDTCILSKLRKLKKYPDKNLEHWIEDQNESSLYISVLTIGEIQSGISKLNLKKPQEQNQRMNLEEWFFGDLIPRFKDRILSIDYRVMIEWGQITGNNKQKGINTPLIDGLIAATAKVNDLIIVTNNINDFLDTGANLYDPSRSEKLRR